ncbi:MAG: TIR domain-containing protein [Alphaproteobacteria bacterium]
MVELYRYAAFISYSSRDAAFAKRLHRALERYGIPSALGKFDLLGSGAKKNRICPVFRDREELSAGDLGELIQANLKASGALIVVCSPSAAASPWVQNEIEHFIGLGRRERIFAIIANTAPLRDAAGADATAASFPPAFRGDALVDPDALEPLAADARKGKDGFRNAWLKVVAGLVGVTPGQLIDRDRRRRRRQAGQILAASMLLAIGLATAATIYTTSAWRGELTTAALELASSGGNLDSLSLAVAGEGGPAALTPGRIARADEAALNVWSPHATRIFGAPKYFSFSHDGRFIAGGQADGGIEIHEITAAFPQRDTKNWGPVYNYVFSSNGRFVLVDTSTHELVLHDLEGGAPADLGKFEDLEMLAVSADGATVAVKDYSNEGYVLRATTGWKRDGIGDLGDIGGLGDNDDYFQLSADGRFLLDSGDSAPTRFYDLGKENAITEFGDALNWMTADGKRLFVEGDEKAYAVYDLSEGLPHRSLSFMDEFVRTYAGAFVGIELSGDGSTVLATAAGPGPFGAAVYDLASGRKIADMAGGQGISYAHLSADGRTILRKQPGDLGELYDVSGGKPIASLGNFKKVFSTGLSPDGHIVVVTDFRGTGLVLEADHAALIADLAKTGGALASAVCAFNGSAMMPFPREIREAGKAGAGEAKRGLRGALRGRPWNPCDWRGFGAIMPDGARGDGWFEGPRQWARLMRIRHFGGTDYRCDESRAGGTVSPVRSGTCRLSDERRPAP